VDLKVVQTIMLFEVEDWVWVDEDEEDEDW
jgi:hypothetical protein